MAPYPQNPAGHKAYSSDGNPVEATWFNPKKGCGFVEIADGSGDAFLSIKALQAMGRDTVSPGAKLNVFVGHGEKGRHITKIAAIEDSRKSIIPTNGTSANQPKRVEADSSSAKEVLEKGETVHDRKGHGDC
jgi:cold shock CspA family protein